MIAAATRSWVATASVTVTGTTTAVRVCGSSRPTYGSRASSPRVPSVSRRAGWCEASQVGPRSSSRASRSRRSADFTVADDRWATVSLSQATDARATTTASSPASAVVTLAPGRATVTATASARNQAWATASTPPTSPSTTAGHRCAPAARPSPSSRRSTADMLPSRHGRGATDALPVLARARTPGRARRGRCAATVASSTASWRRTRGAVDGQHAVLEVVEHRPQPSAHLREDLAVLADLGDPEVEVVLPGPGGKTTRSRPAPSHRAGPRPSSSRAPRSPASRPPRWLIIWVAVVGSFTAGERARIAMSTMIRTANAGSWSIVRSWPSATMPASRRASPGRVGPYTSMSTPPVFTKSPTVRGSTHTPARGRRPAAPIPRRAPPGPPRTRRPHPQVRRGDRRRASRVRRVGGALRRDRSSHHRQPRAGHRRGDRHRAQGVHEPVQVEQQQDQVGGHRHAGQRDAEVGHRPGADLPQQREREREGRGERPQHQLLEPVAVPQPHEPRRERAGGHLHDQHADRDHQAEQADHRARDGREQAGRRRRRVGPPRAASTTRPSSHRSSGRRAAPTTVPSSGTAHRLCRTCCRSWNRAPRTSRAAAAAEPDCYCLSSLPCTVTAQITSTSNAIMMVDHTG